MLWAILFFSLILVEAFIGDFSALTISIGALAAAGVAFFGLGLPIQVVVFTLVSAGFLIFLRPYLRKKLVPPHKDFTAGSFIGETAEVIEKITTDKRGRIKIGSEIWFAESSTDIEIGEKVIILEIDSAIMKVVPQDDVLEELDKLEEKTTLDSKDSSSLNLDLDKKDILKKEREDF